ncbi:MAG: ferrochelatase [Gemmatimonadetes bacterium]|nr:ferrochelatase [Gemmatimonadota bacterium]
MTVGVLVMAYGGPDRLEEVEPYLLDVRGYRPTPPALIEEIRERYRAIGGRSPILEHTRAQADALERCLRSLARDGVLMRVYVGMRHWHPRIEETVAHMHEDGVDRVIGLVMAPHDSELSVGVYCRTAAAALAGTPFRCIRSWHLLPEYLDAVEQLVREAVDGFGSTASGMDGRRDVHVLFTAHSLPARILARRDPYPSQLEETVRALGSRLSLPHSFAYQSAAMTPDPWLGPDAREALAALAAQRVRAVVVAPIGFTSEHVEILYDIDIELRRHAEGLGIALRRMAMMNNHPAMMSGLARLVGAEIMAAGWT